MAPEREREPLDPFRGRLHSSIYSFGILFVANIICGISLWQCEAANYREPGLGIRRPEGGKGATVTPRLGKGRAGWMEG